MTIKEEGDAVPRSGMRTSTALPPVSILKTTKSKYPALVQYVGRQWELVTVRLSWQSTHSLSAIHTACHNLQRDDHSRVTHQVREGLGT